MTVWIMGLRNVPHADRETALILPIVYRHLSTRPLQRESDGTGHRYSIPSSDPGPRRGPVRYGSAAAHLTCTPTLRSVRHVSTRGPSQSFRLLCTKSTIPSALGRKSPGHPPPLRTGDLVMTDRGLASPSPVRSALRDGAGGATKGRSKVGRSCVYRCRKAPTRCTRDFGVFTGLFALSRG